MNEEKKPRLSYDICRCMNSNCELRRECLRYLTRNDSQHWTPFAESVCVDGIEGFIPKSGLRDE